MKHPRFAARRLGVLAAFLLAGITCLSAQTALFQSTAQTAGPESQTYLGRIQAQSTYRSGQFVLPDLDAVNREAVTVMLPDGRSQAFARTDSYVGISQQKLWVGRSAEGAIDHNGEPRSPAIGNAELYLARDGQYLLAFLVDGADQYWLEAVQSDGGLHYWSQHDGDGFLDDHSPAGLDRLERNVREVQPDPHRDPIMPGSGQQRQASATDCAVRILVAYTSGLAITDLQAVGRIEVSTRRFNESNNASNVNFQVEIAAIEEVFYNPNPLVGHNTVLGYFEDPSDGIMDGIHDLRALVDADYCQLITEDDVDDEGCGLASGIGSSYNTAFAVTAVGCLAGNLTFAHEFAHLHGCKHDPHVLTLPAGKAHGYVWKPARWRTIMAYNDECEANGFNCTRVKHWSNPNQDSMGVAFGTPNSSNPFAATHNNRQKLNETFIAISAYELLELNKSIYADNFVAEGDVFQAEGALTLIKPGSTDFTVNPDGVASFRARDRITIQPGFQAKTGSHFSAYLDVCSSLSAAREEHEALEQALADTKLYPNPASIQTRFEHRGEAGPWTLRLMDAYGRERGFWSGVAVEGWLYQDIPVGALPAGFYFMHLERGGLTAESSLQVIH